MLPDPHSTIQEEETEAKPTFAKQVTIILLITSCSTWPQMCVTPFPTDLRWSSRGDASAALVSNQAVLIANARPAKVITKTETTDTQTVLYFQTKSPGCENLGTVRSPLLHHFPCRQAGALAKLSREASLFHRYLTVLVITKNRTLVKGDG